MPRYELFHPDHEYLGQILIEFEHTLGGDRIHPFFEKHGLGNIDPEVWYSAQKFIDVLNDMEESNRSEILDFVSIGLKQVETAIVPPEFASLPLIDLLSNLDAAYHLNNRGTDIGSIQCEVVTPTHVKMIFHVPQPDDIWYGVCYGFMRRFIPKGMRYTVYYDKDTPRRDEGGEFTIIHITWE